jgi:AraC-like DNA-binding protein
MSGRRSARIALLQEQSRQRNAAPVVQSLDPAAATIPALFTLAEVAQILKCSRSYASRVFRNVPGCIDLGHGERRNRRAYRELRIPEAVLQRFLMEHAQ